MAPWNIPPEVSEIAATLRSAAYEAYLVGGCVRDLVRGVAPKDWDVATNAPPDAIQQLFPESIYENAFGTVGVKTGSEDMAVRIVEVTTYRIEGKYTDARHPDEVRFAKTIEEDLSRRDFTVNAVALRADASTVEDAQDVVDPFGGMDDLHDRILRAVGDPAERFREDALRLMRAVRLATELDFQIEPHTLAAIQNEAGLLERVSKERIRDELVKLLITPRAAAGIELLETTGLLQYVIPELREGIGCGQNKHHIYTVFEHNVKSLDYAAGKNYSLLVRMASLLHDVGKPRVKGGDGPDSTFYNHEVVGGRMALKILDRLHFPKDFTENVAHLVRQHLFYYNVGEVTPTGVRRFLRRVGPEHIDDLFQVREADRIGSGVPKAVPYKLRHLRFMLDKVKADPISPKMLAIKGEDVMRVLQIEPSPLIGQILAILLEEVIEDPTRNTLEHLEKRAQDLAALSDVERSVLVQKARTRKEEYESGVEAEMKRKHHVQ